jgi:hypothetical protein
MTWVAVACLVLGASVGAAAAASELELPAPRTSAAEAEVLREAFDCTRQEGELRCELKPGEARTFCGVALESARVHVRDGRVAVAAVFFPEASFEAVVERLGARLGVAEDHSENLRAGMGGTFVNVVRAWRFADEVWMAEQFAGRIARSAVSRVDAATFDAILRARAGARVNGARDL